MKDAEMPFASGLGAAADGMAILVAGCGVLVVSAGVLVRGLLLLYRPAFSSKRNGLLLIAASVLWAVGCYAAPSTLFWLNHDRPPLRHYPTVDVEPGMTETQVVQRLGPPHEVTRFRPDETIWYYYLDSVMMAFYAVRFDENGVTTGTFKD